MEDDEIVIDDSTAKVLAALADVGEDDVFALAKTAEIDPEEFRIFLAEYGETENPHALELLRAAEFLRSKQRETLFGAGLQKREPIWTRLKYLFMGGGIGAILGLLFAPKSGRELRGDIADATRKGVDHSREPAQQLSDRAGEYYEATRERASELYTQAAGRVSEVAQTARDAASRQTGTVAAALEAGRKAYQEEKCKTEMSDQIETPSTHDERAS